MNSTQTVNARQSSSTVIESGTIVEHRKSARLYRIATVNRVSGFARGSRVVVDAAGNWSWFDNVRPSNLRLDLIVPFVHPANVQTMEQEERDEIAAIDAELEARARRQQEEEARIAANWRAADERRKSADERATARTVEELAKSASRVRQEMTNDAAGYLQTFPTSIIAAIVRGEIDLDALAREELVSRGCGLDGKWVGFDAAIDAVPAPGMNEIDGETR